MLNKNVNVVRQDQCLLLFQKLDKKEGWLQCLEMDADTAMVRGMRRTARKISTGSMPELCSCKDLINSWIDKVQKLVTYLCCRRRKSCFSDHFNEGAGNFCSTLEATDRFWSELPNDMLAEIISSIDSPRDYLHSIAVCRRWRSIAHALKSNPRCDLQLFHPLPRKYPLPMLLQPRGKKSKLHYFYSITKRKVNKLHVPEISNKWICGSWRGWLATVDIKDMNLIYLLNPITKVMIPLPPLPTHNGFFLPLIRFSWKIEKIIIVTSEEVAKQSSCTTVAVLTDGGRSLHICRIGDDKWKAINTLGSFIGDVIEFKGFLYFVSHNATLFAIETNPITKVTLIIAPLPDMMNATQYYLAESSGDLLLIARFFHNVREQTLCFTVYRLEEEPEGKIWKKLENLHDQVFFVGCNRTLCLDSNLYPECQGNCIYFADESKLVVDTRSVGPLMNANDNGVYHMNDRKIEPILEGINDRLRFPAIWFSPNPW